MKQSIVQCIETISVSTNATIREVMQAIESGAVGAALVLEDESRRFISVVTDGDVRRALLNGAGLEGPVAKLIRAKSRVARIDMSRDEIAAMFTEAIRLIPVLDGDDRVCDLAIFDRRAHLPVAQPVIGERELVNVTECVLSGWISSTGKYVTEFERGCAEYCGTTQAISTSNGTTALHLALLALGIGPGDEVIVPTLTFIASANAVAYTGARPVFVDSEYSSWNMDVEGARRAITPRTRAVMAVHLYGHPCDMDALRNLCDAHGLALIEDAAEAFGAKYRGRRVGSIGDIATFSFFGNKIITTGEGGMITTNRADLAERCRILRDHGMSPNRRYWHTVLGYNYRITNLQAAIGVAQLEKVDAIIAAKRSIAAQYAAALTEIPGLRFPAEPPNTASVFWLYSLCVDPRAYGIDRDSLMNGLRSKGIETRPVFPVLHRQPIYDRPQSLPIAERISETGLSLPSDPTLTPSEISRIADHIKAATRVTTERSIVARGPATS